MEFDEFKRLVKILPAELAAQFRRGYVRAFVNTHTDFYAAHIGTLKQYADGQFYDGYLWDSLKHFETINYGQFCTHLANLRSPAMVMWDLHSQEKIPAPNYWRFGRESIIEGAAGVIAANIKYLPEDIYIFNEQLASTLICTHEYNDKNDRICVRAWSDP